MADKKKDKQSSLFLPFFPSSVKDIIQDYFRYYRLWAMPKTRSILRTPTFMKNMFMWDILNFIKNTSISEEEEKFKELYTEFMDMYKLFGFYYNQQRDIAEDEGKYPPPLTCLCPMVERISRENPILIAGYMDKGETVDELSIVKWNRRMDESIYFLDPLCCKLTELLIKAIPQEKYNYDPFIFRTEILGEAQGSLEGYGGVKVGSEEE